MFELLSQISVSEVVLLFILLFIIPINFILIKRLKRYESMFGGIAAGEANPAVAAPVLTANPGEAEEEPAAPKNIFPYKVKTFFAPQEKECLAALRDALGDEVDVFPKVALWDCLESTDSNPAFTARLHHHRYDFLVCDKMLGQPMTAIMFNSRKGGSADERKEFDKICAAAGASVVYIEMAEHYNAKQLKNELGIPELEI